MVRSIVELSGPAVLLFGRLIVQLFGCVGSVFFDRVYSPISHYAISFSSFFPPHTVLLSFLLLFPVSSTDRGSRSSV